MPDMDGVTAALEKLKVENGSEVTNSCLDCLLQALQNDALTTTSEVIQNGGITCLRETLLNSDLSPTSHANAAKIIAEMAKHEEVREPFIDGEIIPPLCSFLESSDSEVLLQTCRALGNLCCDCDKSRMKLYEHGGLDKLFHLLQGRLSSPDLDAANQKLCNTACGFFMNLTFANEEIQKKAVTLGAIDLLVTLLHNNSSDVALCGTIIMCIGNLAEPDENKPKFVGSGVPEVLVSALKVASGEDDQLESLLEVIASLADNDAVKLEFAKANMTEALLDISSKPRSWMAQSSQSGEEFDAIRVCTDLLVLLLTGDESMCYMFQDGEGTLFKTVIHSWISSDLELYQISAALAIGNFARNDDHCIKLVKEGVVPPLLKLLKPAEEREIDIRLSHAVLSALRNLAIPKVNKPLILEAGTLDIILPLLKSDMHPVQFKLLGTARMLIDGMGETAVDLGQRSEFIQRVVELCGCEIHAGVSGEASRLLAAVIKHSGSTNVMETVVQNGGLPRLVAMAMSEHALMQNEALVALTLIAASHLGPSETALAESNLLSTIHTILENSRFAVEVQCNVLTLAGFLTQSVALKQAMIDLKLPETIQALQSSDQEPLRAKAASVSQHFT